MLIRFLIALASFATLLNSQAAAGFRIAGQVIRHSGNRPAKGVRVSITMVDHADKQLSGVTGENGEFAFFGLPAAKYSLQVTDHGWTQQFQQLDEFSTAIAVGPGLDSEHIVFPLDAPARIAGAIMDDEGDPVEGAMVYLFEQTLFRGLPQTRLMQQTNTASDGTFHFSRLSPGTYYAAATGRPWYAQNQPQQEQPDQSAVHSDLDLAYPMTYYAGGTSAEAATPLKLQEGERAEIRLTLHAVPALHVKLDGIQTQEGQQINAQLSQAGPGGALINVPAFTMNSELMGIAPGSYVVSANVYGPPSLSFSPSPLSSSPNQPAPTLGGQSVTLSGNSTLNLGGSVETSLKGKVIFDGDPPAGLAIWLGNVTNGNVAPGFVKPDGSFEVENIQPGRYAMLLANNPELYMDSVQVKGGVYQNGELRVEKGAQMEVTITAKKGVVKVNGVAMSGDKPVSGAMVLLVPQDPSHGNYIPRDQSDSDGTFTLLWAIPGRYTLVAIDKGRGFAYADRATIAPYLEHGQVVDVPLAKDAVVQVEVQRRR